MDSLVTLISVMMMISISGSLADRYVLGSDLTLFRSDLKDFWHRFCTPGAADLLQYNNRLFCRLFDDIYGERTFSRRRMLASGIASASSYLLVIGVLVAAGALEGLLGRLGFDHVVVALFCIAVINLVPDFFSLAETRLVLKWARNRGLLGVLFFIAFDLVATTVVFVGYGALLGLAIAGLESVGLELPEWLALFLDDAFAGLAEEEVLGLLGASFLTTYVTSVVWILFVASYLLIRLSYQLFPLSRYVYEQIGNSDRPMTVITGFVNVLVVMVWGLAWLLV